MTFFNPHPPLTSFPVVLIVLAASAELANLYFTSAQIKIFGRTCLFLALGFALLTYFSGYIGSEQANQSFAVADSFVSSHQRAAKFFLLSLFLCCILAVVEAEKPNSSIKLAFRAMLIICLILLIYTAKQGGDLVYRYGAGVYAPPPKK